MYKKRNFSEQKTKLVITGTSCSIQSPLVSIEGNSVRSEERRHRIIVVVLIASPKGSDESLLLKAATGSRNGRAFAELSAASSTTPPARFESNGLSGISAAVIDGHASGDEPGA